jgi:metallo-beta-lactamase class B
VSDGIRALNVVSVCDLGILEATRYPEQADDLERSFRVLRSLPADIWVTAHARWWGRYRKFVASSSSKDPVEPFIDPQGYRTFVDDAEAEFRSGRMH